MPSYAALIQASPHHLVEISNHKWILAAGADIRCILPIQSGYVVACILSSLTSAVLSHDFIDYLNVTLCTQTERSSLFLANALVDVLALSAPSSKQI